MYYAPIKISDNMQETPEGFLICLNVPIARTGDMDYGKGEVPDGLVFDKNGRIKVRRTEKEVFRPETIASFEGKTFTLTHPSGLVDPENWKHLAKGTVTKVRRGEGEFADSLLADLVVYDAITIGLIKKGLREVSCGYDAEYFQADGE